MHYRPNGDLVRCVSALGPHPSDRPSQLDLREDARRHVSPLDELLAQASVSASRTANFTNAELSA